MTNKITIETNDICPAKLLEIIEQVIEDKLWDVVKEVVDRDTLDEHVNDVLSTFDYDEYMPDSEDIARDLMDQREIQTQIKYATKEYIDGYAPGFLDDLGKLTERTNEYDMRLEAMSKVLSSTHTLALEATAPRWYHNAWYRITKPFRLTYNYFKGNE